MNKTVLQVCKSFLNVVPEGLLSSQTSNYHFAIANYVFGSNIGIILNFVLSYISNFLLYFQHMMLVNMKLDISECNRIPLQDFRYRFHWSASFSMAAKTKLTILAFLYCEEFAKKKPVRNYLQLFSRSLILTNSIISRLCQRSFRLNRSWIN